MRKTCAEALSGPLSHLSPKLCKNCARTIFGQFLREKWGSRTIFAHFFRVPWDSEKLCPAHNFCHNFLSQVQFSQNLRLYRTEMSQIWHFRGNASPSPFTKKMWEIMLRLDVGCSVLILVPPFDWVHTRRVMQLHAS